MLLLFFTSDAFPCGPLQGDGAMLPAALQAPAPTGELSTEVEDMEDGGGKLSTGVEDMEDGGGKLSTEVVAVEEDGGG
eukprot:457588-Pyramimonas_sp.AAC.1